MMSVSALFVLDNVRSAAAMQEAGAANTSDSENFSRYLMEPKYVGALADFESNSDLLKCITLDSVMCETSTDFPLTAYDLVSKQPISMGTTGTSSAESGLTFRVHCPGDAASCDKADYINIKVKNYRKDFLGQMFAQEKTISVAPKNVKVLQMVPNTTYTPGYPINFMVLLDGSNSMAPLKESVKETLRKLFDKVKMLNANIVIYSISDSEIIRSVGQLYRINPDTNQKDYNVPIESWTKGEYI